MSTERKRSTRTPDLRSRPVNPAAPRAPRYNVTVDLLEGMIRYARLAHSGSSGSHPSSSGTSHATRHSHHSHRSHASQHGTRHGPRHGSRHSHRSTHCSRQRCRCRDVHLPCSVPKFKRGGQIPNELWIQQMEYYFSITGIPERKHVMGMITHFDNIHFTEVPPSKTLSYPDFR